MTTIKGDFGGPGGQGPPSLDNVGDPTHKSLFAFHNKSTSRASENEPPSHPNSSKE